MRRTGLCPRVMTFSALRSLPDSRLSPRPSNLSGMLPGYISGFYSFDECHIDLARLVTFAG